MEFKESAKIRLFSKRAKAVGKIARQRGLYSRRRRLLDRAFIFVEYLGFIIVFYLLIAIKVLPEYSNTSRFNPLSWVKQVPVFSDYALFLGIFLVTYTFALLQNELFSGKAESSYFEQYLTRFRAIIFSFLITLGLTFLLKTTFLYSRITLVSFVILALIQSMLWLVARHRAYSVFYNTGFIKNHVLIVGAGRVGRELGNQILQSDIKKNHFIGYLDDLKSGPNILGKSSDLENVLQQRRVDVIYITIPSERKIIESMLHTVYKYDVDIRIIPEMFDRMATVFAFRNDLEYPCLQIVKTPLRGMNIIIKRLADIFGSITMLFLLAPLFLALSILIKFDSRGTIFYKQQRVGKNGIPFRMVKFRSMYQEADVRKGSLLQVNEATGPVFKLRNDPRITRIGRFLRKYSLDELPQLWNVLKGEMSLVGPRPPLPEEVEKYTDYHWRRMDVLPGMTGLWQVSGRSDLDFDKWIDLDIYYIERWSFSLEIKILIKTIPVVIKGTGAY